MSRTPIKRPQPAWLDDSEDEEELLSAKKKVTPEQEKEEVAEENDQTAQQDKSEEKTEAAPKQVKPKEGHSEPIAGTSKLAEMSDSEPESECKDTAATITPSKEEETGNAVQLETLETPGKGRFPDYFYESEEEEFPAAKKRVTKKEEKEKVTKENNEATKQPVKKARAAPKPKKADPEPVAGTSKLAEMSDSEPETECKDSVATSSPSKEEKSNDTFFGSDGEAEGASSVVAPPADTPPVGDAAQGGVALQTLGDAEEEPVASTTAAVHRPVCLYGANCYRVNPQHKVDMSHPGDADFAPLPVCPYGTSCYRANPQHKKDYDHTQPPVSPPQSPPAQKARRATRKKKKRQDWDSGDSDDSYESSFIDDSDEDETWTPDE